MRPHFLLALAFALGLMMVNTLLYACQQVVCLPLRNDYPQLLPLFVIFVVVA